MQPQEAGFDWWHALSGMIGAGVGAVSTLLTWVIRAARMEPTIRAEIVAAEQRTEKMVEEKIGAEISHFRETLTALREKISNVEKESLSRSDFNEARKEAREDAMQLRNELREDMADLKRMITSRDR